jgi:hypothetical protein
MKKLTAVSHQLSAIKPEIKCAEKSAAVVMIFLIAKSYELRAYPLPEALC